MSLSLDELGRLVSDVSREHRLGAEVLGVMPSEGAGHYAEVIVKLLDRDDSDARPRRALIGMDRSAAVIDLRADIVEKLRARIAHEDMTKTMTATSNLTG